MTEILRNQVLRNHKDTVFRMLYKNPKNALELYNGLCGKHYTDETQLRYNTLENAVYMNIKNDVSFLIHDHTVLYEQQATWNPNMPLRNLYYIADIFHNYEKNEQELSIYGTGRIELPNPEFVVFYNGGGRYPEYSELRLSDSFRSGEDSAIGSVSGNSIGSGRIVTGANGANSANSANGVNDANSVNNSIIKEEPSLELKVKVYNVSKGKNEGLKRSCPVLDQYVTYTELIKEYREYMPLEEAVEKAVNECIRNGILKDFLMHQKAEVVKMSIYEYDEKEERRRMLKAERAEGYKEGETIGEERGEARGKVIGEAIGESKGEAKNILASVKRLCDKKVAASIEEACEILDISPAKYEAAKKLVGELEMTMA